MREVNQPCKCPNSLCLVLLFKLVSILSDLNYQGPNSAHPTCVFLMVFSDQIKEAR